MTSFNTKLVDSLKILSSKCAIDDSALLEKLCINTIDSLLQKNSDPGESVLSESTDYIELRNLISAIYIDASRLDLSAENLRQTLSTTESLSVDDNKLVEAIVKAYETQKSELRALVLNAGWEYPKVTGVDWSILSIIESSADQDIEEPIVEFVFETSECKGSQGKFKFLCNKNHLLDLQWKVKEAVNFLNKFSDDKKK